MPRPYRWDGYSRSAHFNELYTPEPNSGCWLWDGCLNKGGYGFFKHRNIQKLAHRASYEIHVGDIHAGMLVCHKCDVPCCVNPGHLFLGSHLDNITDMYKKRRGYVGERHYLAKLDDDKAYAIYNDTRMGTAIASEYGISASIVYTIKNRTAWKHIHDK